MDDMMQALWMMATFMLPVLIVFIVLMLGVWILCSIFYMKFCSACGHAHAGFVWIPVPGVAQIVMLQSMVLTGAVGWSNGLIYVLGAGMIAGLCLSFIPIVGVFLTVIGVVCGIAIYIMMIVGMCKVTALLGKSVPLYLLLYLLIPITQPFLYGKLAKGLVEYAEEEYG